MRRALITVVVFAFAALASAGVLDAKETSIAGDWTLTVEQHFGLKLVLEQKGTVVTARRRTSPFTSIRPEH